MDILIKKEVLEDWDINTSEIMLCADNSEIFRFAAPHELEHLTDVKWKIENNTIIIYKEQEKNI